MVHPMVFEHHHATHGLNQEGMSFGVSRVLSGDIRALEAVCNKGAYDCSTGLPEVFQGGDRLHGLYNWRSA